MWRRIYHQRCISTSTWNWPEIYSLQRSLTWPLTRGRREYYWSSVLVPEETGWYLALLRRKDTGRRRSLNSPTRRLLSNRNQLSGRHPYQVSAVPMIADPRDSPLVLSMNEQGRRQEEVRQLITFLE